MLVSIPPRMTLLILRLRSCRTEVIRLWPKYPMRRYYDGLPSGE
jgi:hypothetical protein